MPYTPHTQNDERFIARMKKQGATPEEAQQALDDHYAELESEEEREE